MIINDLTKDVHFPHLQQSDNERHVIPFCSYNIYYNLRRFLPEIQLLNTLNFEHLVLFK